jgi:hypothetical protein
MTRNADRRVVERLTLEIVLEGSSTALAEASMLGSSSLTAWKDREQCELKSTRSIQSSVLMKPPSDDCRSQPFRAGRFETVRRLC